ncbi:PH domain-containing protein [Blastopirellula sp. JC732]|uniref:PH domain-containing protein n=1 Tax=Blastopirellula sediminis TaxID=2894196 RepID=A0A9X1MM25_9BACT|nr:PH domain-containing protein [Blastopirellula sediminis]MCC9607621.1 PH domain-containing protein [Blastopirellula sediminis]MCC9629086.1 PH domain-containing protein [Blastopirellula sediminis]
MSQAIAGVAPSAKSESTVMTVWPSNGASRLGRFFGRLYEIETGVGFLTVGNLLALATSPIGAAIYLWHAAPGVGTHYRLTNRRVVIEKGLDGKPDRWVDLDRFNRIEIEVLPGQAWYHAGDMIFYLDEVETFRLSGVSRPEAFRAACMKGQQTYVGVRQALQREAQLARARS